MWSEGVLVGAKHGLHCRNSKRGTAQRFWKPDLEPPAALGNLSVVLVGPQKPPNVGAVARACNCFEAEDLRIVASSCSITARSSQNAAMGAQRLLWQASEYSTVEDAVKGCYSVAFTRWQDGEFAEPDIHLICGCMHYKQAYHVQTRERLCCDMTTSRTASSMRASGG